MNMTPHQPAHYSSKRVEKKKGLSLNLPGKIKSDDLSVFAYMYLEL